MGSGVFRKTLYACLEGLPLLNKQLTRLRLPSLPGPLSRKVLPMAHCPADSSCVIAVQALVGLIIGRQIA